MTHGLRGLVAWSGLLAIEVAACGNAGVAEPAGGGGTVATGGAVADGGAGDSAPSAGGLSGTGGAAATAPPNPDLVAPTTVAGLCASFLYDLGDLQSRCLGGEPADWAGSWDRFCDLLSASEAEGRLILDQGRVDACYASLVAGVCATGSACADLMVGTVPVGEACTLLSITDECNPDAYCSQSGDCGICQPKGTVGERCSGQSVDLLCGAGLVCDGSSCVPIAHEGDACSGPLSACAPGLDCELDAKVAGEGVCRPVKPPSCMNDGECERGFRCQPSQAGGDGTCVHPPYKKVGEACTFGLSECAGYCSLDGVCEALAHEDEPCGTLDDESGELSETIRCGVGFFCGVVSFDPSEWACVPQVPLEQSCE